MRTDIIQWIEQQKEAVREKWARLPVERRALLKLVSRFEITDEQAKVIYFQEERAKAGIESQDADILAQLFMMATGLARDER